MIYVVVFWNQRKISSIQVFTHGEISTRSEMKLSEILIDLNYLVPIYLKRNVCVNSSKFPILSIFKPSDIIHINILYSLPFLDFFLESAFSPFVDLKPNLKYDLLKNKLQVSCFHAIIYFLHGYIMKWVY